nr:putative ribonuclease H-like domain-containing protein [Tanacetum cinerariifolium]
FAKVEKHSISLEIALQKCKEQVTNDTLCNEKASNVFRKEREQYFKIQDLKAKLQDKNITISELQKLIEKGKGKSVDTKFDKPSVVRQPNAQLIPKPSVLGVNHKPTVSIPQLKSNQSRDKVLLNYSQVKIKKTQVEVYPRILSLSNKMKSVTTCKDSLISRTLNANVVCATCIKCLVDSNHFACVSKMLNDMTARTKKPTVVPISTRKPKHQANKSVATSHKKKVVMKSTKQKPQSYYRKLYETTSNLKLLCDFIEKFLGTIRFGNDQLAPILGYGYLTLFLCSKDETPEVLKEFLTMIQRNLQALVITVHTDRGTEFLNKTLNAFFKEEGIEHQTSTAQTPKQNGVVKRRNRTLVEAARTMLSASKLPLFF